MNLTSLLFMTCLLCGVLAKRPDVVDEKEVTKFILPFSDPNLTDQQIIAALSSFMADFYKERVDPEGSFSDTFSPLLEAELPVYLNQHIPKDLHTRPDVLADMEKNIKTLANMIPGSRIPEVKNLFLQYLIKTIPDYLPGYINSKQNPAEVSDDAFDLFQKLVFERLDQLSKVDPRITKSVNEVKESFTEFMAMFRSFLDNKYRLFTKLKTAFDKLVDDVQSGAAGLNGDSFMPLNDRGFEFARAIALAARARGAPLVPLLLGLLDKLAQSARLPDQKAEYLKWNALLYRRILQLLADNDELDAALLAMKKYLSPSGQPEKIDENYAALLEKVYHQTNPAFAFPDNSLPTQKRKLFTIDLLRNAGKGQDKPIYKIEPHDLQRIIGEFEKIADVPAPALKATHINPQYTQGADFPAALNNQSFMVVQNDLMNALNGFKLTAKPEDLADDKFPAAFDNYLDENLQNPAANLSKNYPMLKLINGKQFLAPTAAQMEMKPLAPEAVENLKARIDEPAFEPIKNSLLSLYAADKPLYNKNVENKDYLAIPESFPAANLAKEFKVLPDPVEQSTTAAPQEEDAQAPTHRNKQTDDQGKKREGEFVEQRNVVNVVVGYLPAEVREFLETSDSIYEQLAGQDLKFKDDYMFAKVKRITSACA